MLSLRGMRLAVVAGGMITALLVAAAADAALTPTPVVTRKGWQYRGTATAGGGYVAYTEATRDFRHFRLFLKPAGMPRIQLTGKGYAYDGGFDGTKLIYAQAFLHRGVSDIRVYDVNTQTTSQPDGVNSRAWEYGPTMSNGVILFGRQLLRRGLERLILRDENADTSTQLSEIRQLNGRSLEPGQVNGDWVTWDRFPANSIASTIYRYRISTATRERIHVPNGRAEFSPSIAPNGTVFYVRTRGGCRHPAQIRENVPGGADTMLVRIPAGFYVYQTYVVDEGGGELSVYYDQSSCSSHKKADVYKLTIS
jgi:hypothetical protein